MCTGEITGGVLEFKFEFGVGHFFGGEGGVLEFERLRDPDEFWIGCSSWSSSSETGGLLFKFAS